jgi:hypothetical protein
MAENPVEIFQSVFFAMASRLRASRQKKTQSRTEGVTSAGSDDSSCVPGSNVVPKSMCPAAILKKQEAVRTARSTTRAHLQWRRGSHSAKTFLEAKLKRAAGDQAAIQLRSETDGQSLELVSTLQVEEIELERQAKRARLLREQKTLARELPGQLAKRDEETLGREERMMTGFRAALATQAEALTDGFQVALANGFQVALAKRDEEHKELQVAREERVMAGFRAALAERGMRTPRVRCRPHSSSTCAGEMARRAAMAVTVASPSAAGVARAALTSLPKA